MLPFLPNYVDSFISPMKFFACSFSICLGLGFALISPSRAQDMFRQSRGPAVVPIWNNGAGLGGTGQSYTFSESNGWTCPTPSFSVGGFGSGGNDWANDFTNYASAGSGINNYGAGVGFTVPFGGQYAKYCNDYAKSKETIARNLAEQVARNNQLQLLDQCYWLLSNNINLDQPAFERKDQRKDGKDGPFASLQACSEYSVIPRQGGSNDKGQEIKPLKTRPPLSEIPQAAPSNLILQPQR